MSPHLPLYCNKELCRGTDVRTVSPPGNKRTSHIPYYPESVVEDKLGVKQPLPPLSPEPRQERPWKNLLSLETVPRTMPGRIPCSMWTLCDDPVRLQGRMMLYDALIGVPLVAVHWIACMAVY